MAACAACWTGLEPLGPKTCPTCGQPRPPATDLLGPALGRCARCTLHPPALLSARAAVAYDLTARRFLLRVKIGLRRELLAALAAQLILTARRSPDLADSTVVVPVPSHPWTTLRRGFEPARELAVPLARVLDLPLRCRLLARRLPFRPGFKRLGAVQRKAAAGVVFRARAAVPHARILLVDDVMTTGATLEACAGALKRAGAIQVRALVWGRTLRKLEPT